MSDRRPSIPKDMQQAALDHLLHLNEHPEDHDARRRWQDWLAADPMHIRAWNRAQRAWGVGGQLPHPRAAQVRRRRVALALAAGVALALTMLFVAGSSDFSTASGEIREAGLQDGSRMVLDGGTRVDVAFTPGGREITLHEGEVFFQVTRDVDRPFRVHAAGVVVTVLGTAFDVRVGGDAVTVAVEGGSVQVASEGQAGRRLLAGEGAAVDRASGVLTAMQVDRNDVAAWREGKLVVENASLAQVAEILGRHYRGHLFIADEALARRRVTGVFDLNTPGSALRAAAAPHGGKVWEWGGLVLILGAG